MVCLKFNLTSVGLVEKCAGTNALCALELEILNEVGKSFSAVNDVFNYKYIRVFKILAVKVKNDIYGTAGNG